MRIRDDSRACDAIGNMEELRAELEIGLRSVAVPVFASDGSVVTAMNVSMSVGPQSPVSAQDAAAEVPPSLQRAARQIQDTLAASR